MKEKWHKLLLRSLDHPLSPEEKRELDEALAESEALCKERDQLLEMRSSLQEHPYQFEPFFAGKVMHRIEQLEKVVRNSWILAFRQVALPGIALLVLLCMFTWWKDGSLSWEIFTGVSAFEQEELLTEYFTASLDYE